MLPDDCHVALLPGLVAVWQDGEEVLYRPVKQNLVRGVAVVEPDSPEGVIVNAAVEGHVLPDQPLGRFSPKLHGLFAVGEMSQELKILSKVPNTHR